MTLRWFIYYCAMCGGCAGYIGWFLGRFVTLEQAVPLAGLRGLFLGASVAACMAFLDTLGNGSAGGSWRVARVVGIAAGVGAVGGFVGAFLGQIFYGWLELSLFVIFGWIVVGVLIGAAPSIEELFAALQASENPLRIRKLRNGLIGGAGGGLLGGCLFLVIQSLLGWALGSDSSLWSPGATGFVVLGASIGLLMSLTQVILRQGWVRVEAGFRPGREILLTRESTTLGRAESSHIALFGDSDVAPLHARIVREGQRYLLIDEGSASGTSVNGERVKGSTPLRAGDVIEVGKSRLRFDEREQKPAAKQ